MYFVLGDPPQDPRYQNTLQHRSPFGVLGIVGRNVLTRKLTNFCCVCLHVIRWCYTTCGCLRPHWMWLPSHLLHHIWYFQNVLLSGKYRILQIGIGSLFTGLTSSSKPRNRSKLCLSSPFAK